jgi:iron complex transport system permease protein
VWTTDLRRRSEGRQRTLLLTLSLALPLALLLALALGAVPLGAAQVWHSLWGHHDNEQARLIITQIRLPRALLAGLMGAVLAVSGAAMQGLFRNPLADPSLTGVTAGASLGASLLIVASPALADNLAGLGLVSLGAFTGGVLAVLVVYRLATSAAGTSVATMLLAGIAITALAGALGSLTELLADNVLLRRISLWKMGALEGADYPRVGLAALVGVAVVAALGRQAGNLNALLLGESEARHLGIPVERVKMTLVVWVAIGVGTSVALAGTIAFVGLVVPHIVRMLIGPEHRALLPAAGLAGALLLIVADTAARVVMAPVEVPVGILTALIGVPFFLSLLRHRSYLGLST